MNTDVMESLHEMVHIKSIAFRRTLNSHAEFTVEFMVELLSGNHGTGSSPRGETISIYEDKAVAVDPKTIIDTIKKDQCLDIPLDQDSFDSYLQSRLPLFGRNNAFALSLAFFNAAGNHRQHSSDNNANSDSHPPRLCLNILNGGRHAYTNPVFSDFPEYLLVSKGNNIEEILLDHKNIQGKVRECLLAREKVIVDGNPVNTLDKPDNRSCIELLKEIMESLHIADKYELMIDASAGDLWVNGDYLFSVTDNSSKTSSELCQYWFDLIDEYDIRYLEDPFHEEDFESWQLLTSGQPKCKIIGDNLYSSECRRIKTGATNKYTHGVIVKPNQAGTVSATVKAIKEAQNNGQIVITSHRSISTESTFLSTITDMLKVGYVKIGPLYSDYSSILRLNELIRLTGLL